MADQLPIPLDPEPTPEPERTPTPEPEPTSEPERATPPEFRYADDATVPMELRGRTAAEAAEIFAAYTASGMGAAPTPPLAPPPPSNGGYASATDLQQYAAQQAAMIVMLARQGHADRFQRWGPEIAEVLQCIPQSQWTLEAITRAVQLVQGRHVKELVAEGVRAATMPVLEGMRYGPGANGMRAGGNGGSSYPLPKPETPIERIPEEWRKHAEQTGIGPEQVREFCMANDRTPDEFFKQFGNGIVTDAVQDISFGKGR